MPHSTVLQTWVDRLFRDTEPAPVGRIDRFLSPRSARQVMSDIHRHVGAPMAPPTHHAGLFLKSFGHNHIQFAHGTHDEEDFLGVIDLDAALVSQTAVILTVISRLRARRLDVVHADIAHLRHRVHGAIAAGGGRAA